MSEWEKFYIESHYHDFVTGDLEKARQAYELWGQIYPREAVPSTNLGVIYQTLGQHDKALVEFREAIRLSPADSLDFGNLVTCLFTPQPSRRIPGRRQRSRNQESRFGGPARRSL